MASSRGAAVRRAAACLDCAVPNDFTQVAGWLQEPAADGTWIPNPIGLAFRAVQARPHARHSKCGIGRPTYSWDRVRYTYRGSLGPTGSALLVGVPSASRAFRRRWASIADETRCMVRSRLSSPRLRTGTSRGLRVMASSLPVPLSGPRQRTRARTPARSLRSRRSHRGGGITPVEVLHRPRSQNQ